MKSACLSAAVLLAATGCTLQHPRDVPLAQHLVGEWVLARPPENFQITSQTDTVLYADGTWDQHHRDYLAFCGAEDADADMYYREHPEEKLREQEKQRQLRLKRRWTLQGNTVQLYDASSGTQTLVDRFAVRRYGLGGKALCGEHCPSGAGPFSFLLVASRGQAPRTWWVRHPISP